MNLPVNKKTIKNNFSPSYTSYSAHLASSVSLRKNELGEWGA